MGKFWKHTKKKVLKPSAKWTHKKIIKPVAKNPKIVTRPIGKVAKTSAKGIKNASAFAVKSTTGVFTNSVNTFQNLLKSPVIVIGAVVLGGFVLVSFNSMSYY